jgi:hypothetical protein
VTAEQRRKALGAFGDGMTLRETADICRVQWALFEAFWRGGERDRQSGKKTPAAKWVEDALHARAKLRAELKLKASAAAGRRAATDYLKLLERLDSEELPSAASGNEIVSAPSIYVRAKTAEVREAAKRQMEASIDLLEALSRQELAGA